jgi:nicotinamide mononucleotide adenylyltransferase
MAAAQRCERLLIGITNPDPSLNLAHSSPDSNRTTNEHNPFSFYERLEMIRASLREAGLEGSQFQVVPMPIEHPEQIPNYIPKSAVAYMTIYDSWGVRKKDILTELGYKVVVMWKATHADRITSGTQLRERMRSGTDWRSLVQDSVANCIMELGLDMRMRRRF